MKNIIYINLMNLLKHDRTAWQFTSAVSLNNVGKAPDVDVLLL
jgi:hypothetical protein